MPGTRERKHGEQVLMGIWFLLKVIRIHSVTIRQWLWLQNIVSVLKAGSVLQLHLLDFDCNVAYLYLVTEREREKLRE